MSEIISDKEIGNYYRCSDLLEPPANDVVRKLIRKLVMERVQNLYWQYGRSKTVKELDQLALDSYGIDASTWPEEWK